MRSCTKCSGAVTKYSKSGLCKGCYWSDPERTAKRNAAIRMHWQANPARREAQREICRESMTPERRAHAAMVMRTHRNWEKTKPETIAKWQQSGAYAAQEKRIGWCPVELRQDYKNLCDNHGFTAAEAREIIMNQHDRNMAEFRKKIGA